MVIDFNWAYYRRGKMTYWNGRGRLPRHSFCYVGPIFLRYYRLRRCYCLTSTCHPVGIITQSMYKRSPRRRTQAKALADAAVLVRETLEDICASFGNLIELVDVYDE